MLLVRSRLGLNFADFWTHGKREVDSWIETTRPSKLLQPSCLLHAVGRNPTLRDVPGRNSGQRLSQTHRTGKWAEASQPKAKKLRHTPQWLLSLSCIEKLLIPVTPATSETFVVGGLAIYYTFTKECWDRCGSNEVYCIYKTPKGMFNACDGLI